MEFREMVQNHWDKVGQDGKEIHQIHRVYEKVKFSWGAGEPNNVLDGEVDSSEGVHPEDGL